MVFSSYEFVLIFLPITWLVYSLVLKSRPEQIVNVLLLASICFYAAWQPLYLILLTASIGFNHRLSQQLGPKSDTPTQSRIRRLWFGVGVNLLALCYYKYTPAVTGAYSWLSGNELPVPDIVLPLAISFFTLQQIAYLVDVYEGICPPEKNFRKFYLFVSFFPQLIAGPIVHLRDVIKQLEWKNQVAVQAKFRATGLFLFSIGLAKKVIIADQIQVYADLAYNAAAAGNTIGFVPAWSSSLLYTFGLYFDFSGYSDMAVGLAMVFGISIPFNFLSPYQATSIIQFWQRWHITLTQFITTYIYTATLRRLSKITFSRAMLVTTFSFMLVGLWHGPRWTYVIFGVLQGGLLVINHSWNRMKRHIKIRQKIPKPITHWAGLGLTFITVNICFVFFRADDTSAALLMLEGMAGLNGTELNEMYLTKLGPIGSLLEALGITSTTNPTLYFAGLREFYWLALLGITCWYLPNSKKIIEFVNSPAAVSPFQRTGKIQHKLYSVTSGLITGILLTVALLSFTGVKEFIYFQF
jgi:alginate O-acetyltransferase complex protein AlgI